MGRAFPGDSGTHGQGQEEIDAYTLAQKLRANNVGIADLDGNIEGFYNDHKDLINSVLNSPDVPREVIKYVIYHELLHRDEPRHSKEFRAKEHRYPDWTEHERFLDVTFPKFNLRYAI